MTKRAALILSGGKAQRFQTPQQDWQDKALAELNGKPLLVHAIENVQSVVDEVLVCVNDEERKASYAKVMESCGLNVKIVVDEKTGIQGPNVGIMTGLKATQADYCLTVPCDMPFLKAEVADYLFTQAKGFEVVVPVWPNGTVETLITVLQRPIVLEILKTLCQFERPRADTIPRAASKTLLISPLQTIKNLDPTLKSFININSQEDLKQLQTRRLQGPIQNNLQINYNTISVSNLQLMRDAAKMFLEGKLLEAHKTFELCKSNFEVGGSFFWAALAAEKNGEALRDEGRDSVGKEAFLEAADSYHKEAKIYEQKGCLLLMKRALADKALCKSRANGKTGQANRK